MAAWSVATLTPAAVAPGGLRSRLDVADADFQAQVLDEALEAYRDVHRTARRRRDAAVATESAAQIAATLELLGQPEGSDEWMARAEAGADETAPRARDEQTREPRTFRTF